MMADQHADERGAALVLALIFAVLVGAVGAAVVVTSRTETLLAASFRDARQALYTAEGALGLTIQDLSAQPDWSVVLTGAVQGSFTDGAALGARTLPGGSSIVLCCGASSLTGAVQLRADAGRSWGTDTPQWVIFEWGRARDWLAAGESHTPLYVIVWVADDPADSDGNPAADNNGMVQIHAQALGPAGIRRAVEAVVERPSAGPGLVRVVRWREVRW